MGCQVTIKGSLIVQDVDLTICDQNNCEVLRLDWITKVEGNVLVVNNVGLTQLSLNKLKEIGRNLIIQNNSSLQTIHASLGTVKGNIFMKNNNNLTTTKEVLFGD